MKKSLLFSLTNVILILTLTFVAVAGCASRAPPPVTTAVTTQPPEITTAPASDPMITKYELGQQASNPQRALTVYSVQKSRYYYWRDASGAITNQEMADDGTAFVIVDAEEKNIGEEYFVSLMPSYLVLSDSDGAVRYGSRSGADVIKTLYLGKSVRGTILYSVPENEKTFKLSYNWGNETNGSRLAYWAFTFP